MGLENPAFIQAIGQFGALTKKDEGEVRALLESCPPPNAVLQKALWWVQNVSDRPKAGGTVGKRITTARLYPLGARYPRGGVCVRYCGNRDTSPRSG